MTVRRAFTIGAVLLAAFVLRGFFVDAARTLQWLGHLTVGDAVSVAAPALLAVGFLLGLASRGLSTGLPPRHRRRRVAEIGASWATATAVFILLFALCGLLSGHLGGSASLHHGPGWAGLPAAAGVGGFVALILQGGRVLIAHLRPPPRWGWLTTVIGPTWTVTALDVLALSPWRAGLRERAPPLLQS